MAEDAWRIAEWRIRMAPGEPPVVTDSLDEPIATMGGEPDLAFEHALLFARAARLRSCVESALAVFKVMKRRDRGPASRAAADLIPVLEAALHGLTDAAQDG